jgi:uncharacterized protein YkwD
MVCTLLLSGCVQSRQEVIVIKENQFYRCEPKAAITKKMTGLINRARSKKRYCGTKSCSPVRPVRWNSRLATAALKHSRDMAKNDFFSHTGSGGTSAVNRVESTGYIWMSVGENILAGRETSEDVVSGWLESSGHCINIMASKFTEIGAACYSKPSSKYGTYWTLVLAHPRNK